MNNIKDETNSSVKVLIRVRPMIGIEKGTNNIVTIRSDEQSVSVKTDQYNMIESKFDKAISDEKSQSQMFQQINPYIKDVFQSYNLTIFAYGQTGSGKTYTMFGRDWQNNFQLINLMKKNKNKQNTPLEQIYEDSGIIPRTSYQIFQCYQEHKYDYNVYCSFLQIYNEKIYDLLNDNPTPNSLNVHQSKFQGIFVEGLGQFEVQSYIDCLQLLKRGQKNRKVRQTSMNAKSSRSHTIFKLIFQTKQINQKGVFSKVALNLCDLAGSQKINKSEKMQEGHLQELKNINLSLTTLGKVIYALSKGQSKNTTAFRQSKLTRLLQQSLTSNTNTFIVCTLSPSSKNVDETLSTLKFAERARHIKLKYKPNYFSSENNDVIQKLQQEMQQLKKILIQKEKEKMPDNLESRMKLLERQNKELKQTTHKKQSQFMTLLKQNRKMKNQLMYMEKVAKYQIFGTTQKSVSINSSQYSEENELNNANYKKKNKILAKAALPILIQQSQKKIRKSPNFYQQRRSAEQLSKQKDLIIKRYQNLQNKKNTLQNSLLYSAERSERPRKKSYQSSNIRRNSRTIELPQISKDTFSSKPRKTMNYREKIKQLQQRLRK